MTLVFDDPIGAEARGIVVIVDRGLKGDRIAGNRVRRNVIQSLGGFNFIKAASHSECGRLRDPPVPGVVFLPKLHSQRRLAVHHHARLLATAFGPRRSAPLRRLA